MSEVCALCKKEFDEERQVKVKKKGLKTLIRVCTEKGLDDLRRYVLLYFILHVSVLFLFEFELKLKCVHLECAQLVFFKFFLIHFSSSFFDFLKKFKFI